MTRVLTPCVTLHINKQIIGWWIWISINTKDHLCVINIRIFCLCNIYLIPLVYRIHFTVLFICRWRIRGQSVHLSAGDAAGRGIVGGAERFRWPETHSRIVSGDRKPGSEWGPVTGTRGVCRAGGSAGIERGNYSDGVWRASGIERDHVECGSLLPL